MLVGEHWEPWRTPDKHRRADCKSVGESLHRFESCTCHQYYPSSGAIFVHRPVRPCLIPALGASGWPTQGGSGWIIAIAVGVPDGLQHLPIGTTEVTGETNAGAVEDTGCRVFGEALQDGALDGSGSSSAGAYRRAA